MDASEFEGNYHDTRNWRGDNGKVVLCLEGIPVQLRTRMWPQEETVTQGERGNQVRNGHVRQQIIITIIIIIIIIII